MGNIQTTQKPMYFINHRIKHIVEFPVTVPVKLSVWNVWSAYWSVQKSIKAYTLPILNIYKGLGVTRSDLEETGVTMMFDIECAYTDEAFHIVSGNESHGNLQGYLEDGYTKVVLS